MVSMAMRRKGFSFTPHSSCVYGFIAARLNFARSALKVCSQYAKTLLGFRLNFNRKCFKI